LTDKKLTMKKHLAKFLFLFTMIIGLSITASAQKPGKKKKEPKRPKPPKIIVPKKQKPPKKKKKNNSMSFAEFVQNRRANLS